MNTAYFVAEVPTQECGSSIQEDLAHAIDDLLASLPNPEQLSSAQRRGIIARYTAVLEGNFIYWMTGAYLAVGTEKSRHIIADNLLEEVRDSHPMMLRRFAQAAHAIPTESDNIAIDRDLANVRLFIGRLSGVRIVVMMAFFEGFIQRFMAYLAELAAAQGSVEREYTDVHGVCDVAHSKELYEALEAELALDPVGTSTNLFEGVDLLRSLIQKIVDPVAVSHKIQPISLAVRAMAS